MQLAKYNPNAVSATDAPASWEQVKYWADVAGKFQQASLAAQVMAGFALAELKKNLGIKHGTRTDLSTNLPHDAGSWPELVQANAGISDDTARRWIVMAEGIKSRWKKLSPQARLRELMSVPVGDWSVEDTKVVSDALYKVTDGSTQLEFMRELGLATKPPGNPNAKGGVRGTFTAAEQAEKLKQFALENSSELGRVANASNRDFFLLDDLEVKCQISVLENALKFRRAWLAQPASKRNADIIVKMVKEAQ